MNREQSTAALLVAFMLALALMVVFAVPARAGVPPTCRMSDPKFPVCNMKTCMAIGTDGNPNGSSCSKFCKKECCGCDATCPKERQQGPNPEEWVNLFILGD